MAGFRSTVFALSAIMGSALCAPTWAQQPEQPPGDAAPAQGAAEAAPETVSGAEAEVKAAPEAGSSAEAEAEAAPEAGSGAETEGAPAPAADAPPPPPSYGTLGGEPEPEIEEGDWDPWEHVPSRQKHEGFYLRLSIGLGWGRMSSEGHLLPDVDELDLTGGGLGMSIGIGGALTDNLILHGDIYQATIFTPNVEVDGVDYGDADELAEDFGIGDEARIAGLGVGLAYYFMPVNIYVSGSVGFGQAIFEDFRGDVDGSNLGLGLDVLVGKEWWVGNDWGLGVAGQFVYLSTDDDVLGDIDATAFNVLFSATYN
ncbi:MAG: hypothetical protein PVI30_16470 [Myxococcales bacterium]|jgi:hypothetical protein